MVQARSEYAGRGLVSGEWQGASVPKLPPTLHRDGPMITGGLAYTVAELLALSPQTAVPSRLEPLDALTGGGLTPGVIWTVAGTPGRGVTSLVTKMAAHLAQTARVGMANDHMATHLLRDHLLMAASSARTDRTAVDRIEIASWIPIPDLRSDDPSWFGADYDVLIVDCLDEMLRPRESPEGPMAVRTGRWLREMARRSHTALILTARGDRPPDVGRWSFDRAWQSHWARPVFDDIADMQFSLYDSEGSRVGLHAMARGYGHIEGSVHRRTDGRLNLLPD